MAAMAASKPGAVCQAGHRRGRSLALTTNRHRNPPAAGRAPVDCLRDDQIIPTSISLRDGPALQHDASKPGTANLQQASHATCMVTPLDGDERQDEVQRKRDHTAADIQKLGDDRDHEADLGMDRFQIHL